MSMFPADQNSIISDAISVRPSASRDQMQAAHTGATPVARPQYVVVWSSVLIESLRQHVIALTDCALRFRVAHSELSSPAIS